MGKIEKSKDLLLVLLYADDQKPIEGRTRLMKMVFLFEHELKKKLEAGTVTEDDLPKFEAYDYGPFSKTVFEDLEFLVNMGFVEATSSDSSDLTVDEREEYEYWQSLSGDEERPYVQEFQLTDLGKLYVEKRINLSESDWPIIDKFKKSCTKIALPSLLRYVYSRYPKYTKNSKIRGQVLG